MKQLHDDMSRLGVKSGGILMVHSSLSSIGNVSGGAQALIQSLRNQKGDTGTLVMPSHSWREMNSGCRRFSVADTATCVGVTCEKFRCQSDVYRSIHPTHSVAAAGPDARWLTEGHENAGSPCGSGTPYAKMLDRPSQVLFLGVDLSTNTLFHTMETIAELPYSLSAGEQSFAIETPRNDRFIKKFRLHQQGVPRRFAETEEMLVNSGVAKLGKVGCARSILLQTVLFRDVMLETLQKNPQFLCA